jgi:hypothetical protein
VGAGEQGSRGGDWRRLEEIASIRAVHCSAQDVGYIGCRMQDGGYRVEDAGWRANVQTDGEIDIWTDGQMGR